jgi:hypothetical protein
LNLEHVLPHAGHLVLNQLLRALSERDHRESRRHADDDAEHGQRGLDFVLSERMEAPSIEYP